MSSHTSHRRESYEVITRWHPSSLTAAVSIGGNHFLRLSIWLDRETWSLCFV